ncbi:sialic acid-binding Ig-like lectin 12 isoform X2 [Boleophthalmus pectinirostris]|uniref:sialic acid-binding Ig-like lectin 12 isoform X2 n=1 Tax=Boleophthalmus pectinirostris TaxID=150288 RepID=UPI00242A6E5F|nr:sialic acid-binding Ig-like lectin 12 isoform X2 [Boleophthalmus pectinirostris]
MALVARCTNVLTQMLLLLLLCSVVLPACEENSKLKVTMPKLLKALSGSCLQIPCTFTPLPHVNLSVFGVWMKNDHQFGPNPGNVIFNSSLQNSPYYFRIENRPFLATDICDPLNITVTDSPWSPTVKVSGKQTETEVVTITCSAVTPCPHAPPQLTWDLHQDTAHITETNTDGTFTTKITQNITLTDAHDGLMIKCNASYPVSGGFKMADSNITLNVSYGPKNTSVEVSASGSLSAGQSVTLSCSSRAKPPVHLFTWFRHSSQGPVNVSQGHTYSFNFTEEGQYYCVASNTFGNESSPDITLSITETNTLSAIPWEAILGAGIGLIIVFCLAVFFMSVRSKRKAAEESQTITLVKTDKAEEEEDMHYGEIDFSNLSPKGILNIEQEETVYSQVRVSKAENATTQAPDVDELYANVNKN